MASAPPAHSYSIKAEDIRLDTSNFDSNLSATDTDVQKALDTLDDLISGGGSGDVSKVGDCASGDCLDGSSDGGTYIRLYDGDSHYLQLGGINIASNKTINFGTVTDTKWCKYTATGTVLSCDVDPVTDTNTTYTASGTLLGLSGTAFSLYEGTLTSTKGCKYVSGTGLVCDQDYLTSVASDSTWTVHGSYPSACSAGQYVSAIGDTLTCATPTDTNTTYTASGTLLNLTGTAFSLKEGTLTTTKGCKYVSGTGLVCDQDYLTGDVALGTGTSGNYVSSATATGGLTLTGTEGASLGMTPCTGNENYIQKWNAATGWTCQADTDTNTTYTGGDHLTLTGTDFDVDDDFLLNNGDVGTGVYDFGGATSFEIVNAADPTVDAAGEIAIDTTSDHIEYYGGAKRVIGYRYTECRTLEDPADADDDIPVWAFPEAITITDVHCQTEGGTSIALTMGDGTNSLEAVTCDADGADDDGSIANGTFTANETIEWDFGAPTGAVGWVMGCITYVLTED